MMDLYGHGGLTFWPVLAGLLLAAWSARRR